MLLERQVVQATDGVAVFEMDGADYPQPCMFVALVEALEPAGASSARGGGVAQLSVASLSVFDKNSGLALATQGITGPLRLLAEEVPLPVPPVGSGPF